MALDTQKVALEMENQALEERVGQLEQKEADLGRSLAQLKALNFSIQEQTALAIKEKDEEIATLKQKLAHQSTASTSLELDTTAPEVIADDGSPDPSLLNPNGSRKDFNYYDIEFWNAVDAKRVELPSASPCQRSQAAPPPHQWTITKLMQIQYTFQYYYQNLIIIP